MGCTSSNSASYDENNLSMLGVMRDSDKVFCATKLSVTKELSENETVRTESTDDISLRQESLDNESVQIPLVDGINKSNIRFLNRLPVEVYLMIRNFLFLERLLYFKDMNPMNRFLQQDRLHSWINFLSISNHEQWRALRKSTMVWSLNNYESRRFANDEAFREYIGDRMIHPKHQLMLQFCFSSTSFSALRIDSLYSCEINTLNIQNCDILEIPSSGALQTLHLSNCDFLERLGNYPRLNTLRIHTCPKLANVGEAPNLSHLHLHNKEAPYFPLLSLENLQQLTLCVATHLFVESSHRFPNLRELELRNDYKSSEATVMVLPQIPCPLLQTLIVAAFRSVNLSDLHSLEHLTLNRVKFDEIIGRGDVLSRLKSFSYDGFMAEGLSLSALGIALKRVMELGFSMIPYFTTAGSFQVSDKIKSLELNVAADRLDIPTLRYFERVSLRNTHITDISMLSKTFIVCLSECSGITDISALRDVSYLELNCLPAVSDFSPLGKQKFLRISYCPGLRDEAVNRHFSAVDCLHINYCENITRVVNLNDNRFIFVSGCDYLTVIELHGNQYVEADFHRCWNVTSATILGRVYSLKLHDIPRLTVEGLHENCMYYNNLKL
jgi:hypothetical protein